MLNDISSPAALLETRRSGKPRDLVVPGPSAEQLRRILTAAMRVPDHGKLAPWRFVVIDAEQRDAFAKLLHRAYRETRAEPVEAELRAIEEFARQAPTMIVALSWPDTTSPIPLEEQRLSAGAACMSLLLAAHAEGFVGGWLTGWAARSETVRDALAPAAPSDARIAGFLFIGTPANPLKERPRPDYDRIVSVWSPPKE